MSLIRVYLAEEPHLRQATLYVYRGDYWLTPDNRWVEVIPGAVPPPECGIRLPIEALQPIAEAFHPKAGHTVEVTRLEEALAVERQRVDRILDTALHPAYVIGQER